MAEETPPLWHAALDDETRGHITNRGWDKLEAPAATQEAVKAFRELEKMRGIPADQIAYIPKDATDPKWNDLWKRLGAPDDPKGYVFDGVKMKDGSAPPEAFVEHVRGLAASLHLPVSAAAAIASSVLAYQGTAAEAEATAAAIRGGAEKAQLAQNWGANFDLNMFTAQKAVEAMGLPKEMIAAIESTQGYAKTMEAFRVIGSRMSEADLLRGGGTVDPGRQSFTREQAVAEKGKLMGDTAWVKKYLDGDKAAVETMDNLHRTILGPAPTR